MGNWIKQQALKSAKEEQENERYGKLAGYFFNLSQLTYAALVLGALVFFFQSERITLMLVIMLITGAAIAYLLASAGNNLLKK